MTETTLERVARAIYESPGTSLETDFSAAVWADALKAARAALEAMRRQKGPSESHQIGRAIGLAMEREGLQNISIDAIWGVWDAMIDAAHSDQTAEP